MSYRGITSFVLICALLFINMVFLNQFVQAETTSEDIYDGGIGNDQQKDAAYLDQTTFENLCQGDVDWYNFSLDISEILIVTIYFAATHNLHIELYDRYGGVLNSSGYGGGVQSCSTSSGAMTQNISIRITGDNFNERYDMGIDVYKWSKSDDTWDNGFSNQNDNIFSASWFGIPEYPSKAHLTGLIMWDYDWYKFNCSQNFYYTFSLLHPNGEYSFVMELFNFRNDLLRSAFHSNATQKNMDWTANYTGYVYLLIKYSNTMSGLNYELFVQQMGIMCNTDDKEDNDYYDSARFMDLQFYVTLSICSNDMDFFKFDVPSDKNVKVEVNASKENSFTLTEMMDASNPKRTAQSNQGWATLVWESNSSSSSSSSAKSASTTTVIIRIAANANFTYNLNISYYTSGYDSFDDNFVFGEIPGYPAPIFLGLSVIMLLGIIFRIRKRTLVY